MGKIIGIDLGTTNSLAAVWQDGESRLIPNSFGEYLTPSVVRIDEDGSVYVGKIAKERLISHPERTAASFKRSMGIEKRYTLGGKSFRPEELSALVLKKLKEDAQRYLGEPVEEAVISVPAYFNDMARKATKDAGALAGLRVERIINEPSAAALACRKGSGKDAGLDEEDETILVFDFGGGTLDVSLVDCFDNVIEIISVSGDNHLGGNDFDQIIAEQFCKENDMSFEKLSARQKSMILKSAADVKCALTEKEETVMVVTDGDFRQEMRLSNKKLIQIAMPLFHKLMVPVKAVLNDGVREQLRPSEVVLVGGSCKMPCVQQYIRHFLSAGKMTAVNPDCMVALGVGLYAGIKERNEEVRDLLLTDICPFTLGTGLFNPVDPSRSTMEPIIERNSVLPCRKEKRFQTVGDFQKTVKVDVYQGEAYYVDENIFLGELMVGVPMALKGQESVTVRYTYDINGILIIDVRVDSTGEEIRRVITTGTDVIPQDKMDEYVKKLEQWDLYPAEQEENQLVIAWGERLFAQVTGELREEIGNRLRYFQQLQDQDTYKIRKHRNHILAFFKHVERILAVYETAWVQPEEIDHWYEERTKDSEEAEEEYTRWYDGHFTS